MKPEVLWHGTVAFAIIGAGLAIVAGVAYLLYGAEKLPASEAEATSTTRGTINAVTLIGGVQFTCVDGKSFAALYKEGSVILSLSDSRSLILPKTSSGTGDRYTNPDESFIHWTDGNNAYMEEGGVRTYSNCVLLN